MITETTGRNEIQAMNAKYKEVLAWEAEFAQQVEELSNIDSEDSQAYDVANQIIQAWEDRKNIQGNKKAFARSSNARKIDRLEEKFLSLGYRFTKHILAKHNDVYYQAITIQKVN